MYTTLHDLHSIAVRKIYALFQPLQLSSFLKTILFGLLFIMPATTCLANAGQLDPTFADAGLLTLPNKSASAIARQPDGKFLISKAAFLSLNTPAQFTLTRYNPDGSVDKTFGNGEVLTDFNGGSNSITSIAVLPNGKIVAVGHRYLSGKSNLVVARYNADGSLDNSFNGDGRVAVPESNPGLIDFIAVIQSDEKIVVASYLGMIRLNTDGAIDNTFGVAGRVSFSSNEYISSIAIQSDNKIIAVGKINNDDFIVNRYNTNGTPDNSFDGDGQAITDFGGLDQAVSVAVQNDGKIVVSGYTLFGHKVVLARYNVNGSLDTDFDGDGKLTFVSSIGLYQTILLQPDGKILVAGGESNFLVARFNSNGSPDTSFDGDGFTSLPIYNARTFGAVLSGNDVFVLGTDYYSEKSILAAFSLEDIAVSGLNYRFYTGDWNTLPEFNSLIPVKTGLTSNVDISIRPSGTNDHFAFVWEGYINIQTPGNYTFETISDDGSKFYFNSFYTPSATALVTNDGLHAAQSATGSVNIPTAGLYPVAITYFEKDGGEAMQLYWTAPGMPRQLIPNALFTPKTEQFDHIAPSPPANLHVVYAGRRFAKIDWENSIDNTGVAGYQVFYGGHLILTTSQSFATLENLPPNTYYYVEVRAVDSAGNFSLNSGVYLTTATSGLYYKFFTNVTYGLVGLEGLTPAQAGSTSNVDISIKPSVINENYAFLWQGYINIPAPGTYTFETISDDGSRFYFNTPYSSTADPLVNNFANNGQHPPLSVTRTINIPSAGLYPVAVTYNQYGGGQTMQLFWQGPGIPRQRIPDAAFTDDTRPGFLTNGLNYKYYEGSWTTLPDFSALTPVQTGQSATVDISKRPAGKNDNFAFVWEGYITIAKDGFYTFETISDDGSKLYFNSKYVPSAIATLDNDGLHPAISAKATVGITKGTYPISITFFENSGDQKMEVYWSGPSITRELISTEVLSPNPSNLINRLNYSSYAGTWTMLPNFNVERPVKTGASSNIDINNEKPERLDDTFAIKWQGNIYLPAPGNYTFETVSDDGSKLYFNDYYSPSAHALVDNDGLHAARSATGSVYVYNAGVYPIGITYFEQYGMQSMEVYWTGPGIPRQRIPDEAFTLIIAPPVYFNFSPMNAGLKSEVINSAVASQDINLRNVYPNPFDESVTIDFYNAVSTNDISIGLYDLNGRKVFTNHPGRLPAGNNIIKMNLNGINIKEGVYIIQIQKNGIAWKTAKVVKMKK